MMQTQIIVRKHWPFFFSMLWNLKGSEDVDQVNKTVLIITIEVIMFSFISQSLQTAALPLENTDGLQEVVSAQISVRHHSCH